MSKGPGKNERKGSIKYEREEKEDAREEKVPECV